MPLLTFSGFSHNSGVTLGMAMSLYWLVSWLVGRTTLGKTNVLLTGGCIVITFVTDIHGFQRMDFNNYDDPLTYLRSIIRSNL